MKSDSELSNFGRRDQLRAIFPSIQQVRENRGCLQGPWIDSLHNVVTMAFSAARWGSTRYLEFQKLVPSNFMDPGLLTLRGYSDSMELQPA